MSEETVNESVQTQPQQEENKDIMAYESVLPENFDGTFRFTNPTKEDFVGIWNGKEYRFPAGKTVPMLMPEHSPLEIQHIRKKFAKNLAEREYFKSQKYETIRKREGEKDDLGMIQPRAHGMSHAGQYTTEELTPYIQSYLNPLEETPITVKPVEKQPIEDKLSRNDDGELNSEAIDDKTSLRDKALGGK